MGLLERYKLWPEWVRWILLIPLSLLCWAPFVVVSIILASIDQFGVAPGAFIQGGAASYVFVVFSPRGKSVVARLIVIGYLTITLTGLMEIILSSEDWLLFVTGFFGVFGATIGGILARYVSRN